MRWLLVALTALGCSGDITNQQVVECVIRCGGNQEVASLEPGASVPFARCTCESGREYYLNEEGRQEYVEFSPNEYTRQGVGTCPKKLCEGAKQDDLHYNPKSERVCRCDMHEGITFHYDDTINFSDTSICVCQDGSLCGPSTACDCCPKDK